MKEKKKISICVPCYNEERNVRPVYEAITMEMKKLVQYEYEIVFRDNASTDETYERLKTIAREDYHVKIIENIANYGPSIRGATYKEYISGDIVISIACDLQDPVDLIPEFIKGYEEGYQVVAGKKIGSDEGKLKYLLRHIFYNIIDGFSEKKQYKHISGIMLFSREMYELSWKFNSQIPFRFLIAELGCPVKIIPYRQRQRSFGKSKMKLGALLEFSLRALVVTSTRPIHIATSVGFISSVLFLFIGIIYLILKLLYWNTFHLGIAPIIIIVSFVGSIQLFLTGLVGEYLAVVYSRVSKQVPSIVKETVNIDERLVFQGKKSCNEGYRYIWF